MAKRYTTIKKYLTREQKETRVRLYNEDAEYFGHEPVNEEEFINRDIADEYILMKCIKCGAEETVEADIAEEMMGFDGSEYPKSYCFKCNTGTMVPIDIYNSDFKKK